MHCDLILTTNLRQLFIFYLHFKDGKTVSQRRMILLEGTHLIKSWLKLISTYMLVKLDLNHLATRIRIIWNDCPTICNDDGISQPLLFGPLEIPRNHTMPWSTVSFSLLIKVAKSLRLQGYDALYKARMMSTNLKYPSVFWTTSLEAVWAAEKHDITPGMVFFLCFCQQVQKHYMHSTGQPWCG